jgi:hypothetical protein
MALSAMRLTLVMDSGGYARNFCNYFFHQAIARTAVSDYRLIPSQNSRAAVVGTSSDKGALGGDHWPTGNFTGVSVRGFAESRLWHIGAASHSVGAGLHSMAPTRK